MLSEYLHHQATRPSRFCASITRYRYHRRHGPSPYFVVSFRTPACLPYAPIELFIPKLIRVPLPSCKSRMHTPSPRLPQKSVKLTGTALPPTPREKRLHQHTLHQMMTYRSCRLHQLLLRIERFMVDVIRRMLRR